MATSTTYGYGKSNDYAVRLVRGGQWFLSFVLNGDGTVTEENTGLMWAQCSAGQSGSSCSGTASTMTWANALAYAENATLAGYNDWRLPNREELRSLVDYGRYGPAIDRSVFPNTPGEWFWSASPDANYSNDAWGVNSHNGGVSNGNKSNGNAVRLVRGGQCFGPLSLNVALNGQGSGRVTSDPPGIDCGSDCTEDYERDTTTALTLTAIPDFGSALASWGGACSGNAATCTVPLGCAATVTATFELGYTLYTSTAPSDSGTVSCTPNPVAHGQDSTCTATPASEYTFVGWSGDCSGTDSSCTLSDVTGDRVLIAHFAHPITTAVTPSGTGTVTCTPNPVDRGGSSTCTATPATGYHFSQWSGDCSGDAPSCELLNVTSAPSITATFALNDYPITTVANPSAGGTVSCTPNPVDHGSASQCTATANSYYNFARWSGACSGSDPDQCRLRSVTGARTVTAHFDIFTYNIATAASPSFGGTVSCTPNPVAHGADSTCTATPASGYAVSAWSGDCSGTDASCTLEGVTADQSVTASFTRLQYAINTAANPSAGGSVTCMPNPVTHGSSSLCQASANHNYAFENWSGACSGTSSSCALSNVIATRNVTANFRYTGPITHAINTTATPSDAGSVSCSPNPVLDGEDSTCTATPATGYALDQWSGDCSGSDPTCTLSNVTAEQSVTATFVTATYPIRATATPTAGGSVTCTPNPVEHGQDSTCTATPAAGYRFGAWSGACSGTDPNCTLATVTAEQTVTATFARLTYDVQAIATPSEGGTVSCTPNPVPHGENSTCTATPASGSVFSAWGDACSGISPTCTLSAVTSEQIVTGYFTASGQPSATHSAPDHYVPGGLITVTNRFDVPSGSGALTLLWTPQLPAGWTVVAVSGDGQPELAANGEITFLGNLQRPLTLNFSYQISIPSTARYPQSLSALARYRDASMSTFRSMSVAPAALLLDQHPIARHRADYEEPHWQIDSTELSDVLLYWRTGAYHLDTTRPDGYNAGSGDTNGPRHSADYQDPAWRLDSFETSRVIGYWRAGAYHVNLEGADGYAPGAQQTANALALSGPASTEAPPVTQTVSADTYFPGDILTVTVNIGQRGATAPLALLYSPVLPSGWDIVPGSVRGDGVPELSLNSEDILFLANSLPQPLTFEYQIRSPAAARGTYRLTAQLAYQHLGMSNPASVAPNALTLVTADDCVSEDVILTNSLLSGTLTQGSETAIRTQGAVTVASGATLELTAPHITLNPGFQVEAGGRLLATSASLTCTRP